MKKVLNIFLVMLLVLTLTGCGSEKKVTEEKQTDAKKFAEEYNSVSGTKNSSGKTIRTVNIPDDNPFVYSTAEKIAEKIENGDTFVVYFGFATCPWCRSMIEQLVKCAKDNDQDKIYYVDVLDIRDTLEINADGKPTKTKEGTEGYNKLLELMNEVLSDYTLTNADGEEVETGEKRIYAPNVVAVVNGEVKKMVEGTSSELKDPYAELTDEMKEESYNILKCIFECLGENENMCKKNAC